ncbi:hypothetical protein [Streptacidiphilus carbonis]|nr:hypothetical protein [Streptacidiphilus carbonis]
MYDSDDDNAPAIPRITGIPRPRRSPEQSTPPIPPQRDNRTPEQD